MLLTNVLKLNMPGYISAAGIIYRNVSTPIVTSASQVGGVRKIGSVSVYFGDEGINTSKFI
jgi:hypothetical protein